MNGKSGEEYESLFTDQAIMKVQYKNPFILIDDDN